MVIPRNIVNNIEVSLDMGSHDLIFKNPQQKASSMVLSDLRIAHFPLRSIEQCMSKILVGWPNLIEKNKENNVWGHHWRSLFEKIKQKGLITYEDLEYFGKNYSLREYHNDIEISQKNMNIDFCRNIEIKYEYDYSYLSNLLDNYIYFVEELLFFKKKNLEYKKEMESYKKLIKSYQDKIESIERDIKKADVEND